LQYQVVVVRAHWLRWRWHWQLAEGEAKGEKRNVSSDGVSARNAVCAPPRSEGSCSRFCALHFYKDATNDFLQWLILYRFGVELAGIDDQSFRGHCRFSRFFHTGRRSLAMAARRSACVLPSQDLAC